VFVANFLTIERLNTLGIAGGVKARSAPAMAIRSIVWPEKAALPGSGEGQGARLFQLNGDHDFWGGQGRSPEKHNAITKLRFRLFDLHVW